MEAHLWGIVYNINSNKICKFNYKYNLRDLQEYELNSMLIYVKVDCNKNPKTGRYIIQNSNKNSHKPCNYEILNVYFLRQ